jgi:hypothetical protein
MAGFTTNANEHLIRSSLWSNQLKDVLEDELFAMRYVDMITDFPDGDTLNIPSIGQAEVQNYGEDQEIVYTAMDTGNFQFTITQYKASATYVTNKMKQDSFYMSRVIPQFVPKQHRALMKVIEADVLSIGPDSQTASNTNTINGAYHRYVGGGTNEVLAVEDVAKAAYALKLANVPPVNLVGIIDPTVEYTLSTLTNIVNLSNNPRWEGVITKAMSTGMKFVANLFGFDLYVSQNLKSSIAETVDSLSVTAGVANIFFSASPDVLPIVFNMRQPPKVDSEYNKDRQRDEYVTTARWGRGLYRPENLVTILTDTDQVYV